MNRKIREVGLLYTIQITVERLIPDALFRLRGAVFVDIDLRESRGNTGLDREVQWATEADLDALAIGYRTPAELRKRMRDGARVAYVERDGKVVSFAWFQPDFGDLNGWLRMTSLPGEDVWSIDAWTISAYRGQNLYPRILGVACAEFARAGYTRMLSVIMSLNRNSLKASEKIGTKRLVTLYYLRLLGLTLLWGELGFRLGRWSRKRYLEILF